MYLIDDLNVNNFFDISKVDLNLFDDILNIIPDEYSFKPILRQKLNKLLEQDLIKFENFTDEQIDIEFDNILKYTDEQIDAEVDDILKQEHVNESLLKQIKQLDYNQFEDIVSKIIDKLPFKDDFFKHICCDEIMIKCIYNVVQNDFHNTNQVIESSILNGIQTKSQEYQQMLNKILE